jgi:hypothetical protein
MIISSMAASVYPQPAGASPSLWSLADPIRCRIESGREIYADRQLHLVIQNAGKAEAIRVYAFSKQSRTKRLEPLEDWRNFATGDEAVISIDNDRYLSVEIEMPGLPGFGGLPKSRSVEVKNERATFACEDTRVQIKIVR